MLRPLFRFCSFVDHHKIQEGCQIDALMHITKMISMMLKLNMVIVLVVYTDCQPCMALRQSDVYGDES